MRKYIALIAFGVFNIVMIPLAVLWHKSVSKATGDVGIPIDIPIETESIKITLKVHKMIRPDSFLRDGDGRNTIVGGNFYFYAQEQDGSLAYHIEPITLTKIKACDTYWYYDIIKIENLDNHKIYEQVQIECPKEYIKWLMVGVL